MLHYIVARIMDIAQNQKDLESELNKKFSSKLKALKPHAWKGFGLSYQVDRKDSLEVFKTLKEELSFEMLIDLTCVDWLDEKENKIQILTDDDMKLTAIKQILTQKMSKRGISIKSLSFGKSEQAGGDKIRLQAEILNGIPTEKAKKIVKIIKEEKIKKIQAQIQGEQIRITGPKRDHLQDVIELLKVKVEDLDLQYINFRD